MDKQPGCLAVGRLDFVEGVKEAPGMKAHYRTVETTDGLYRLHEPAVAYNHNTLVLSKRREPKERLSQPT